MLYERLKKFIGAGESGYKSTCQFSCGVNYWRSFEDKSGLYSVNISYRKDSSFRIMCRNNYEAWREKLDRITESAEYDLIVTQSTPQTQAISP